MPKMEHFCQKNKKLHTIKEIPCVRNTSGYLNSGHPLHIKRDIKCFLPALNSSIDNLHRRITDDETLLLNFERLEEF